MYSRLVCTELASPSDIIVKADKSSDRYDHIYSYNQLPDIMDMNRPDFLVRDGVPCNIPFAENGYCCDKIPGIWCHFVPVFQANGKFDGYVVYISRPFDDGYVVEGDVDVFRLIGWFEQIKQVAIKYGIYTRPELELPPDDEPDEIVSDVVSDDNGCEHVLNTMQYDELDSTVRIRWRHGEDDCYEGNVIVKSFIIGWLYSHLSKYVAIDDRNVYSMNTDDEDGSQYLDIHYSTQHKDDFEVMMKNLDEFITHCGTAVDMLDSVEVTGFEHLSGSQIQEQIESMSSLDDCDEI